MPPRISGGGNITTPDVNCQPGRVIGLCFDTANLYNPLPFSDP